MPIRTVIFTDTLDEMNGVCRFIRDIGQLAHQAGEELAIVTSSPNVRFNMPYRVNFAPLRSWKLPYYPDVPLILPRRTEIAHWLADYRPDVIEISTPGPMGLLGLRCARKLRVPALGVYHTDFPAFVRDITGRRVLASAMRWFMRWFYGQMDGVFSRTRQYVPLLQELGIAQERIHLIQPFVDTTRFHPSHDETLWTDLRVRERYKLLFCGRVSKEKNMPMLVRIFAALAKRRSDTALIIAGYGPYLEAFKEQTTGLPIHYLGYLSDAELARLYGASDLYLFPSLTDTLGQVVLESQACGTPVLVSDVGGPREVVADGQTGRVLPGGDVEAWVDAIDELLDNPDGLAAMSAAAVQNAGRYSPDLAFTDFRTCLEEAVQRQALNQLERPSPRSSPRRNSAVYCGLDQ